MKKIEGAEPVSVRMNDFSFASCFNLNNLMDASLKCRSGVRWKRQTQQFQNRRLTCCLSLLEEIESGSYRPKDVDPFEVCERGKQRVVKPVAFRDRVAQRCFCDHVLIPAVESYVIDDCSAVLPGRGLSFAFDRVRGYAEDSSLDSWVVKFDYSDYFASIDRGVLEKMLSSLILDERLVQFARASISRDSPGLDLGSHVSQLCATMFPTTVDMAISSLPCVTGYHRYMDDGIVFCRDRDSACEAMSVAYEASESIGLRMNGKKTFANRVTHPFVFCKMRFSKQADGSVRMNVRKQQTRRSVRHARSVARLSERVESMDVEPVRASFIGYVQRGDADLSWLAEKTFSNLDLHKKE